MHKVYLAPMAGITDLPFRALCFDQGLDGAVSEMVSAKGLCFHPASEKYPLGNMPESALRLLAAGKNERVSLQLFGRDPGYMAEAARRFAEGLFLFDDGEIKQGGPKPQAIDINFGCPAPKIVKNGEGSALMREPEIVREIVSAVVEAQDKPVTIKMRLGFAVGEDSYIQIARICEEAGASAICLHARYRQQYYSGEADWEAIGKLKQAVRIPVIGNGDIRSGQDAVRMFEMTNCDAIMVGRAAQGNPWIFREINAALSGKAYESPAPSEIADTAEKHMNALVRFMGEVLAVSEMRKHLAWYTKGFKGAAAVRRRVNACKSIIEMAEILEDLRAFDKV